LFQFGPQLCPPEQLVFYGPKTVTSRGEGTQPQKPPAMLEHSLRFAPGPHALVQGKQKRKMFSGVISNTVLILMSAHKARTHS
jgi:hypothetical protein